MVSFVLMALLLRVNSLKEARQAQQYPTQSLPGRLEMGCRAHLNKGKGWI
jgi:hypothetical protein